MFGLLGKKIGMTQVYQEDGKRVCVTVIETGPCAVLAIREKQVQLGFDEIADKKLKRPIAGYFKKLNVSCRKVIQEIEKDPAKEYKVGEELKVDLFKVGDFVDIRGTSLGKGFQGGMKRWNWKGGPMTHGSTSHRRVGSIGSSTTPGRVLKGHNMPGHMGAEAVTVQNLLVVKIDVENNLLLVEGAIPGHKNGYVTIRIAKKKKAKPPVAPGQAKQAKKGK